MDPIGICNDTLTPDKKNTHVCILAFINFPIWDLGSKTMPNPELNFRVSLLGGGG